MKWIDCKDQMPAKGQICLIYRPEAEKTQDNLYRVAVFTGEHFACYVQPSHWAAVTVPGILSEHRVCLLDFKNTGRFANIDLQVSEVPK